MVHSVTIQGINNPMYDHPRESKSESLTASFSKTEMKYRNHRNRHIDQSVSEHGSATHVNGIERYSYSARSTRSSDCYVSFMKTNP